MGKCVSREQRKNAWPGPGVDPGDSLGWQRQKVRLGRKLTVRPNYSTGERKKTHSRVLPQPPAKAFASPEWFI